MKTLFSLIKGLILWTKSMFVKPEPKKFITLEPWDDDHFGDHIHFT